MNPTFRLAESHDIPALHVLIEAFYKTEHLTFSEATRVALRHLVTDGTLGRVYLIMADETIAGYLVLTFGFSLEFHGRDAFIDEFFIREEFRSRGLGSAALKFIEDDCRKMGIEAVHLEVDHINARGQSLYRRWGYTDHRRFLLTKWV